MTAPIPASSVPAVRKWLLDQLTAQLAADPLTPDAQLLVCLDGPGPANPEDIVSIGKATRLINPNSLVGSGGPGWLEERYSIEIILDIFRGDDDAAAVFDRAALLVDQICAIVRGDPSLGGLVLVGKPISSEIEGEWDDEHLGRHGVASLQIECYQRI